VACKACWISSQSMGNSPCKETGQSGHLRFDLGFDPEFDSAVCQIPTFHGQTCENPAYGRLNTSKSGTILIAVTNELAAGGGDDIHENAGIWTADGDRHS